MLMGSGVWSRGGMGSGVGVELFGSGRWFRRGRGGWARGVG